MTKHSGHGPLGEKVNYPSQYDPSCLHPILRKQGRDGLGIDATMPLPFAGVDIWNAYELSWLNESGKPQVACAEFRFPADSPNIIESKSFKLYLNSFNQSRFRDASAVQQTLAEDLSAASGAEVQASVFTPDRWGEAYQIAKPEGECLDDLDINPCFYAPNAELLEVSGDAVYSEILYSHLLRSRCPVTSQPDWASVEIRYRGTKINREQLLAYIVSFREHDEFHEHCVERIFSDISRRCEPEFLAVYARYTRRGGLDINPWRSSDPVFDPPNSRGVRQ
ncbi:NADPH-dependent 7-cyano-7-deazaguanine reductase QueF [uncultured Zhongshania sp.]|uniref:NADPH-dependent 7-cyano-7-deazaguanine reductase QueF n=1 Tax=uncultured Zhongshania sp. TaxID=1642288 RepID=UPI001B79E582|nr:NADPH-dependent 7-cyano-7-deazaguanine reductase QueF [uncultured Zhongshania sp.]MBQ0759059.1 NADPH-dependent 7-cyano-7-deazaguanine reductase QueF [Zhongshania sp.]